MSRKILAAFLLMSLVSCTGCGLFSSMREGIGTYSKGMRTGYVIKLSEKGTLKSSLEGTLLLGYDPRGVFPVVTSGSESDGTVHSSNLWSFSVTAEHEGEVRKVIEDAMRLGARVLLYYEQKQIGGAGVDTDYLVYKAELVGVRQDDTNIVVE